MPISPDTKASANPTKEFFVNMLTRDISLEDCILDLIDNSVDNAWQRQGGRPMGLDPGVDLSEYKIQIDFNASSFSISDNCGGMTLENAVEHAFSFGRRSTGEHSDYSIGVYGIGMKRAVFKIGKNIRVRSTTIEPSGEALAFVVPINVASWISNSDPPWDFDLHPDAPLTEPGVQIAIDTLTEGASDAFGNPAFLQNLRRTISRDYSFHIGRGLNIYVGDRPVIGWKIELRQSEDFIPVRLDYVETTAHGEVSVEMIGGMAAAPPDDVEPDESAEGDRRFGWYVVCNGRIVLAADKSSISGWGTDGWPQWHSQYAGFLGLIFFTAAKAAALPLTTTKRSVDVSSDVLRRARPKMRDISRTWINYTNTRKQAIEEAKRREASARPVALQSIAKSVTVTLPSLTATSSERLAHVNYSVPLSKLKKLAQGLGSINMTNRDVGLRSFDYAYDDFVGDE